jgi:hypothetical protein
MPATAHNLPGLTRIGTTLTREDLLSALVMQSTNFDGTPWAAYQFRGDGTQADYERTAREIGAEGLHHLMRDTYATDGAVLIRLERAYVEWARDGDTATQLPRIQHALYDLLDAARQWPVPSEPIPELPALAFCDIRDLNCAPENWNPEDPDCIDMGPEAYGLAPANQLQRVAYRGREFSALYLRRLRDCLPGVELIPSNYTRPDQPLAFRWAEGQGQGLLMPLMPAK